MTSSKGRVGSVTVLNLRQRISIPSCGRLAESDKMTCPDIGTRSPTAAGGLEDGGGLLCQGSFTHSTKLLPSPWERAHGGHEQSELTGRTLCPKVSRRVRVPHHISWTGSFPRWTQRNSHDELLWFSIENLVINNLKRGHDTGGFREQLS
jgi:hypothetical protein